MNQMIAAAVGEKLAALLTAEYLGARAQRGSRRRFEAVLRLVRNVAPVRGDELPKRAKRTSGVARRRNAARG